MFLEIRFELKILMALVLSAVTLGYPSFANAATPNPPILLCQGGIPCGGGPPNGVPDLGALPSFVAGIQWAVAPDVLAREGFTQDTDGDGVNDAQLWPEPEGPCQWDHCWHPDTMNGRRMVVGAGSYGDVVVACTDCEIDASRGASFSSLTFAGGTRQRWIGGTILGSVTVTGRTTDLMINGLHVNRPAGGSGFGNFTGGTGGWERLSIINSTLELQGGSSGGDWVFYVEPDSNGTPVPHRDLIMYNVRFENSGGQLNRFQAVDRMVIKRFAWNMRGTAGSGMGFHKCNSNVYLADGFIRGQGIGQGGQTPPWGPGICTGEIENVEYYNGANNHWSLPLDEVTNVTVNDSDCHTSSNQSIGEPCTLGQATAGPEGNVYVSWDGQTVPDMSGIGASSN